MSLMRKVMSTPNQVYNVASVIGRRSLPGWIFLEAEHLTDVHHLCKDVHHIFLSNTHPADSQDILAYLTESPAHVPTEGSWIRIHKGPYTGDLAFVIDILSGGLEVTVRIVPRINLNPGDVSTGKRKRGKASSEIPAEAAKKPDQRLFDPSTVAAVYGENSVEPRNQVFIFQDEIYRDGLLEIDIDGPFMEGHPTREELMLFAKCPTVPPEYIKTALDLLSATELRNGDTVKIIAGQLNGSIGKIQNHRTTEADIFIDGLKEAVAIPISYLRRCFAIGDHVKVVMGDEKGSTGMVTSITQDIVGVWDIDQAQQVSRRNPSPAPQINPCFCSMSFPQII
jgi:transcription elongation factor SPT5